VIFLAIHAPIFNDLSTRDNRWDEKADLQRDALSSQGYRRARSAGDKRRPAMKKHWSMVFAKWPINRLLGHVIAGD
jgi:hypothetical protein